jgi:hypothetical protein
MSHIKHYKILQSQDVFKMEQEIDAFLSQGWELSGNLIVNKFTDIRGTSHFLYTQSVIFLKFSDFDTKNYID